VPCAMPKLKYWKTDFSLVTGCQTSYIDGDGYSIGSVSVTKVEKSEDVPFKSCNRFVCFINSAGRLVICK
jgi:hypothetical protein